ncbi:MAG: metallophosphoesterase family protein [Planctomycetota bacterium]
MKQAILSDIHGNLEALTSVLADARDQRVDRIICLGDLVGYGPNPKECIDLAEQFDTCTLGNHDLAALFDPEGFSCGAERAIFWTRSQLETRCDDKQAARRRLDFLAELPRSHRDDGKMFVHGSARSPLNEYVFPEDVFNLRKLERIFAVVGHVCFQGHTHVPGVFTEQGKFFSPRELDDIYVLGKGKCMVNVGSVGQPRDGDPRACYVIMEDDVIHFRRVSYPVEETVKKIHAISELDSFLGDRLREGD